MLVQLLPEQVNEIWNRLAPMLEETLPPTIGKTIQGMSNMLRAVLLEKLDVWLYVNEQEEVVVIMTTCIQTDPITLSRNLLIYTFLSVRNMDRDIWGEIYEALKNKARSLNCNNIVAYTQNDKITDYINKSNIGQAKYTLLELEV